MMFKQTGRFLVASSIVDAREFIWPLSTEEGVVTRSLIRCDRGGTCPQHDIRLSS
jgi:hypothetical protein